VLLPKNKNPSLPSTASTIRQGWIPGRGKTAVSSGKSALKSSLKNTQRSKGEKVVQKKTAVKGRGAKEQPIVVDDDDDEE